MATACIRLLCKAKPASNLEVLNQYLCAFESAALVNIGEMIDLAIGSPEVGVVDFNMLQTVLHCLAQQVRCLGKNVELRGSISALPAPKDNGQTIAISEYVVDTNEPVVSPGPDKKGGAAGADGGYGTEPETILVVERVKKIETPNAGERLKSLTPARPSGQAPALSVPATSASGTTVGAPVSLVTISKFNLLENTVEDLKNRVYGSLPKNEEILEEVRSQTNMKAITEMWTSLNVSSRLEAAETGIGKLSSLVEDLIAGTPSLKNAAAAGAAAAAAAAAASGAAAAPAERVEDSSEKIEDSVAKGVAAHTKDEFAAIKDQLQRLKTELDNLTSTFYSAMKDLHADLASLGVDQQVPAPPLTPSTEAMETQPSVTKDVRRQSEFASKSMTLLTLDMAERLNELEKKLKECCESIGKNEGVIQDQLGNFQDQLEYLQKHIATLAQNQEMNISPDIIKELQGMMQLFQTVQEMQEQLKQVHDTALQLASEKDDRQLHTNSLLEQIELLKTIKLDREDMVEAMAEKADARMLARKVSFDQFEMACDDLSKGLEHALGKLNMQEALWQQALDDIQREIETKLDKMELSPVKEFFNSKLKQLQENLKQMASLRREVEAAGTKRRLLRDVNCISCDAQAVMPMVPTATLPVAKALQPTMSMKPYLSYELDSIRKTQQSQVQQRNMHDWETIDKQMAHPKPQKVRSETDKHICNRYCGGSHTVTTPAQRVARLGHFVKQWGPDVLPLSSGLATGDDGRLYKVTATENGNGNQGGANVDAAQKCQPRKSDPPKPIQKPLIISAECRCLEGENS